MVRVLALHGYAQNAHIFSSKMGALRKSLGPAVELVFCDAPHVIHMPTNNSADFDSNADSSSSDPNMIPRAWWLAEARDGYRHFRGYDESIEYLRTVLNQQGPFDACFGFSQGAACAAVLAALLEKPHAHPAFEGCEQSPFKFVILSGGPMPLDPRCQPLFQGGLTTRSLHILGRGDTVVEAERSLPLTKVFHDARIEWHDGGHHTPSKASWRNFLRRYCEAEGKGQIEGPSGGEDSAPPSRPDSRAAL